MTNKNEIRDAQDRVMKAVMAVKAASDANRDAWGDAWRASERASEAATVYDATDIAVKRAEAELEEARRELRRLRKEN
jgi:hypothetical protein